MATQTFDEARKYAQAMKLTAPDGREYEGFYTDPKIDRSTLPDGWHSYDFRHDDDGCGIFVSLETNYVLVNNAGCFFTQTEIPELQESNSLIYLAIDPEEWEQAHSCDDDDDEYECPECPEREDTDWDFTFC